MVESLTMQDEVEILKKLSAPLHTEAIQRTRDKQTHKGYDTDGYGYQFCANRFNEVLGLRWGYVWEIINEKEGTTSTGKLNYEVTVKLGIWVLDRENLRHGVGGHNSRTHFDASKGAFTNAFKKAAAMWGVGRHAYEGALDDDNDPWPEWWAAQNGPESQEQEKQSNQEQGKQAGQGSANQSSKEQAKQSNSEQGKQPNQEQGKQNTHRPEQQSTHRQGKHSTHGPEKQSIQEQPAPSKQEDSAPSEDNGNGQKSSQQNGHTPPPGPSSVGNGKEAGLRRRIIAKLETIFGRSEEMINAWLDRNFGIKRIEVLSNLHADILEKILEKVEEKFKDWKHCKNN